MARTRKVIQNSDDTEDEGNPSLKKSRKKRAASESRRIKIGNISDVSGKVTIATGNVTEIHEAATEEKNKQELQNNELQDLKVSVLEKLKSLSANTKPSESIERFHLKPLKLNQGKYLAGRTQYLGELLQNAESQQTLFISGRGGMGRTSLLEAGLMPLLLKQGHLPIFVSISEEPIDLTIKRGIMTGVDATTYLKNTLNLEKFLERAAGFLGPNRQLWILLDDFENVFEKSDARKKQLADFETQWRISNDNLQIRWLFSIDQGFRTRISSFQPEEIMEVLPLDRAAATQAFLAASQDILTIDEDYLSEILNELEKHRVAVKGACINPADLQIVLRAVTENESHQQLSAIYENKKGVDGMFEDHLENVIREAYVPGERDIVWQILKYLNDEYRRPVSQSSVESIIKLYGLDEGQVSGLLQKLRQQHFVAIEDEQYELANVNLKRAIQHRQDQETLLKNARDEYVQQLNQIRTSALRGLFGGGLGFALFRWIVEGPVGSPAAFVFFTLLYATIGGLTGLLFTFFIDIFIARYRSSHPLIRYLLSALTGLVTFGLGLALFVYLSEAAPDKLLQFAWSSLLGGIWGIVTGTGIAWAMTSVRAQPWKILAIAALSACNLYIFNVLFHVLNKASPIAILAGGFWFPFVMVVAILFRKNIVVD